MPKRNTEIKLKLRKEFYDFIIEKMQTYPLDFYEVFCEIHEAETIIAGQQNKYLRGNYKSRLKNAIKSLKNQ